MNEDRKPRGFGITALALMVYLPVIEQLVDWVTSGTRPKDVPPRPRPKQWLRQYRNTHGVFQRLAEAFGIDKGSAVFKELIDRKAPQKMIEWPPTEEDLAAIIGDVMPGAADNAERALVEFLNSPEGYFFARVTIPCVVLFRHPPSRLLRAARRGSANAFDALLRLDKMVVLDPVLAMRWAWLMDEETPIRRKRWKNAMMGRPRAVDRNYILVSIGGLISQLARREGCDMTAPEVRDFMLMFAGDREESRFTLPSGEAFKKALQRHRDWPLKDPPSDEPGH